MSIFNIPMILSSLSAVALAGTVGASAVAVDTPSGALPMTAESVAAHEANAKPEGKRRHARDRNGGGKLCKEIECTEAQRHKLREIRKETRGEATPERRAVRDIHLKLAAEFAKDEPNARRMNRLNKALAGHRARIAELNQEALMETHAVLTPEQRAHVAQRLAQRGPRGALSGGGHGKKKGRGKKGHGKKGHGEKKRSRN